MQCLKLSCLYAINNHPNSLIVEEEDMKQAIELSKWLLSSSYQDMSEKLFVDPNYKINRQVFNRIKKTGKEGMERSKLYGLSHLQSNKLDEQLKTLLEAEEIREELIVSSETNRKQKRYFTN